MEYNGKEVDFYVILTIDTLEEGDMEWLEEMVPDMDRTEHDPSSSGHAIPIAEHGKWTGMLSEEELDALVWDYGLIADDIETGGSLTLEFGWMPAISFRQDAMKLDFLVDAYVTPMPRAEAPETPEEAEKSWNDLKEMVLDEWGV